MEAISQSGAAAGVLTKDGIIFFGVQHSTHALLEPTVEKMFKINSQAACAVAGFFTCTIRMLILILFPLTLRRTQFGCHKPHKLCT
jgi:20S proteasome alpha/beta subunit